MFNFNCESSTATCIKNTTFHVKNLLFLCRWYQLIVESVNPGCLLPTPPPSTETPTNNKKIMKVSVIKMSTLSGFEITNYPRDVITRKYITFAYKKEDI